MKQSTNPIEAKHLAEDTIDSLARSFAWLIVVSLYIWRLFKPAHRGAK